MCHSSYPCDDCYSSFFLRYDAQNVTESEETGHTFVPCGFQFRRDKMKFDQLPKDLVD